MKSTISKTVYILSFLTAGALAISSCTKDQNYTIPSKKEVFANLKHNVTNEVTVTCGTIPQDLAVPQGNQLLMKTYATGVQVYQVRRNVLDPNVFEWVNIAPVATLYSKADLTNPIAQHYKGPTWEFIKGPNKDEKVVGSKIKGVVVEVSAVAWLLLKAVDSLSSAGNKITFIQRICTTGGLPPSKTPGEWNIGELDSIPYTASYLFYTKD